MDLEDIVENLENRHPGERDKTLNLVAEGVIQLAENGGGGSPFKMSYDSWDFSPDLSSNVDTDPGGTNVYWGWREFSAIPWRDEDPDWVSNESYHVVFRTYFWFTPESPGATDVVFEIPYDTYAAAGTPLSVIHPEGVYPLAVTAIDADSVVLPASASYYVHYNSVTDMDMLLLQVKVDAATAGRDVNVYINTQFITEPQLP